MFADEAYARILQIRADAAAKQAVAKYGQTAPSPAPPTAWIIVDLCLTQTTNSNPLPAPYEKGCEKGACTTVYMNCTLLDDQL